MALSQEPRASWGGSETGLEKHAASDASQAAAPGLGLGPAALLARGPFLPWVLGGFGQLRDQGREGWARRATGPSGTAAACALGGRMKASVGACL